MSDYIKTAPLIKVQTISARLAKQIRVPCLAAAIYKELKNDFKNKFSAPLNSVEHHAIKVIGWADGESVFKGYDVWKLILVQKHEALFWLLLDKSEPLPGYVPQLFIS